MMISDADLMRRLQAGSLDALGSLYDRHRQLVFRTALAITGDPDAAADLLQDVFLRLHRFADHVDCERPLEPWLYRMTANLAYTWVNRHRWLQPIEDVAEWLSGYKRNQPQQAVEFNEESQQVEKAILGLPLSHRVVVVMYYVNDLSIQEIAEVLDVPAGTVKSRLHYGRQILRQRIGLLMGENLPDMQYEFT